MKENMGFKLAKIASSMIDSTNDARKKRRELWDEVLKAREAHEQTSKIQSSKAFPHALSASLSLITSIAASAIAVNKDLNDILASFLKLCYYTYFPYCPGSCFIK